MRCDLLIFNGRMEVIQQNLVCFECSGNLLGDEGMAALSILLKNCWLSLFYFSFHFTLFIYLSFHIQQSRLESIDLSQNQCGALTCGALSNSFSHLTALKTLKLQSNQINSSVCFYLSSLLLQKLRGNLHIFIKLVFEKDC
jgi:Ran GTPase-activating protein (RanGAP) involved in mRNA processing and transport